MKSSLYRGSAALGVALLLTVLASYPISTVAETQTQNPASSGGASQPQLPSSDSQIAALAIAPATEVAASDNLNAPETLVAEMIEPPLMPPVAAASTSNSASPSALESVAPPQVYTATAYSFRGRTASGRLVGRGVIAADRRVLPLGTRVRLDAGAYSGEYIVADTGGAIRGRRIDIWIHDQREAIRFGRRQVRLTVLTTPHRRAGTHSSRR